LNFVRIGVVFNILGRKRIGFIDTHKIIIPLRAKGIFRSQEEEQIKKKYAL
jgi:hypothetical protein